MILGWCVTKHIIPNVLCGNYLVRESDVEVRPELINNAIDNNIALTRTSSYICSRVIWTTMLSKVYLKPWKLNAKRLSGSATFAIKQLKRRALSAMHVSYGITAHV